MNKLNSRVEKVVCVSKNMLELTFKNGEIKIFDVAPYLSYPIYEELKDEAFFNRAYVLNGTVAWDEYIDFDPDILYQEGKELAKH